MFATGHWKYLLAALVLHVAIVVMLTVSIHSKPRVVIPQSLAIQGIIVDHSAERLKHERAEKERQAKEQADAAEKVKEQEAERQAAERKEAERKENERKETERKETERKEAERKVTERQAQIAAQEKQRVAEQERRRATERKQREADESKRLADIKNKQAEKQRNEQAAREQAQRESELKRQLADEEGHTQAMKSGAADQYYAMIKDRIMRNWNKPDSARPGIQCEVAVTQAPGGTVLTAVVGKCNGDQAVRQSIEAAVFRSNPLPMPSDMRLFQRSFTLLFNPKDD